MTVDVAARLAAGRTSAANTQAYVSACHAVGYRHPDLTAHGAQVVEWYGAEDGLDLYALEADCNVLRATAAAADEAVRITRDGHAAATAAWHGESGSAAADFTDRHCAAGMAVAYALHAAVEACEALRDGLGRLVDQKVGAAVAIDDRRAGERPAWLAAAATVTGGGAAREEAIEFVTQQITPYVDTDIRTEWLTAMRSTTDSVAAGYDDALRQLSAAPAAHFAVPGQLGAPSVAPPDAVPTAAPTVPAAAIPAAPLTAPVGEPPPAPLPPSSASVPDAAAAQPLTPAQLAEPLAGPSAAAPAGVPAMPDSAGGLSGLVGQIADALGGLVDGAPDTPVADNPLEPDGSADSVEDPPDATEADVDKTEETVPEEVPAVEESTGSEPDPAVTDAEPAGAVPSPPPPEPLPAEQPELPAQPGPDEQTPCEIAADELAQVGQ